MVFGSTVACPRFNVRDENRERASDDTHWPLGRTDPVQPSQEQRESRQDQQNRREKRRTSESVRTRCVRRAAGQGARQCLRDCGRRQAPGNACKTGASEKGNKDSVHRSAELGGLPAARRMRTAGNAGEASGGITTEKDNLRGEERRGEGDHALAESLGGVSFGRLTKVVPKTRSQNGLVTPADSQMCQFV